MNPRRSAARWFLGNLGVAASAAVLPPAATVSAAPASQLSSEEAALVKLNAGRRAFNEKNYSVASAAFKEFLASNAGHREAPAAWYGLGLCILQSPAPDFTAAADAFHHSIGSQDFSEHATALYYYASSLRHLGNRASADALARPDEAASLRDAAKKRYAEAAVQFAAAEAAFKKRNSETPAPAPAPLSIDMEWSARARCDAAEMLLRMGKYKEALDLSAGFQSDPILGRSRYRQLGLYHLGYAQFELRDYLSAGRSLSQLAPFAQDFGLHARYLLARVHHLSDERPEAAALYKAVADDFESRRTAAGKALQDPKLDPVLRVEDERLAHGAVPDYVARSRFYLAVLQYEENRFAEAGDEFARIVKSDGNGPLAAECKLRLGYCLLEAKKYDEAAGMLAALKENKEFSDRALWWSARAKVGQADPANAQAYQEALKQAMEMLRTAATRAKEMSVADSDAKTRRGDILLELGDTQQLARQFKEAANTYGQIVSDDPVSDRAEESWQRKITALHMAGQFKESDAAVAQFLQNFPKSTLLPSVLFRHAENAYLTALAAADGKEPRPAAEQRALFETAISRYQKIVAKYPEYGYIDLAKQSLAICQARVGRYADAIAVLQTIPETSRSGDLAMVPYLLADCEIRTLAPEADDALTAERLIQAAEDAAKYLEAFVGSQPKSAQAPDALLKLGYCYQRVAAQVALPEERLRILTKAREAYDRSLQQFPGAASQPDVVFERARVLAEMGDTGGAQKELARFQNDPLRKTPNAPLALLRLSVLRRATGQPQQAVELMKHCREEYEAQLAADAARSAWTPMLRYEQALGLQDLHKLPEARAILEDIVKQFPGKPQAINAQWRIAQCRREEAAGKISEARAVASRPGASDSEIANAYAKADEPLKALAQATEQLRVQADAQALAAANAEPTLRTLYELAWCYRVLGDAETDAAGLKLAHETLAKVRSRWPKDAASPPAVMGAAKIPPADIPVQPSEEKARANYQRVIFAGPATPLGSQARFELAELLSQRGNFDEALNLLATALENQPPRELAQRIKVRVAAALIAKSNPVPAMAQLKPILADKNSPVFAEARYLSGEADILQQDWSAAIESLLPFRDQDPFRNVQGIADRALLRLGYAYAQAKQWDPSRQAYEALLSRFPQSQWIDEARFGMGWALQSQQRFDDAVNVYNDLRNRTIAEPAARALLNIGVCRLEQKHPDDAIKALLMVPLTYDYPDCTAGAWYQAARAQAEIKQPQEAAKLWTRVVKEYPATSWASLAQQRLSEIK